MIDISDGLSIDLARLCRASGVGAVLQENAIPIASLNRHEVELRHALHGGDEYQLLFTVPPGRRLPAEYQDSRSLSSATSPRATKFPSSMKTATPPNSSPRAGSTSPPTQPAPQSAPNANPDFSVHGFGELSFAFRFSSTIEKGHREVAFDFPIHNLYFFLAAFSTGAGPSADFTCSMVSNSFPCSGTCTNGSCLEVLTT